MLFKLISAILVLSSLVEGYADYEDITDGDTYEDYGEEYNDGNETSTISSYDDSTINRVRRYDLKSSIKTLGPDDVREVRGALKELLSGIAIENPFTPFTMTTYTPLQSSIMSSTFTYDTLTKSSITTSTSTYDTLTSNATSTIPSYLTNLLTEIFQYTNSEPTRSKHLKHKLIELDRYILRTDQPTTPMNITLNITQHNITTSLAPTSKRPELDIPRLLAIISHLAREFETNLTKKLNETIITMTLPTCTTPTSEPPITSEYDAKYTGSVVSKCFVCGLTIPKIPRHAHCADAFAGDFLPLVPVDPTAKGKISRFRKYCKYSNVNGFKFNKTEPRTIMGRWTGGCSVRWIDLSGIYTQRSCRNRLQPTMGRHFASKRMAKLERTLWNVENGCIISPMATLVPLSRGISLYARFHACVCTGSWCNSSSFIAPSVSFIIALSTLLCVDVKF